MTVRYPGLTGTFSKGRSQFPSNAPYLAVAGQGGHVICDDGHEYVDWTAALGAVSLGYGDKDVLRATLLAAQNGNVFGLPHRLEWEYADALSEILPWGDDSAVKYGKHGSDVTSAAVRAARFITGRDRIISIGYHGWHDTFCPNKEGIPQAVRDLTSEGVDWRSVDQSDCACVVVEPESMDRDELVRLREWCTGVGALLVFDEVLSGFRTPGWTVGQWRGVVPDYLCLAKAIGNGWPLSVIAGPSALMRPFAGDIGYSFTFAGECVSLAAGMATLKKYRAEPVIDRLWSVGSRIQDAWNAHSYSTVMPLSGNPSRLVVKYPSLAHRTLFSQEMFRRKIMWTVGATPMYAHTDEDLEKTIAAIGEALDLLASADDPAHLVEGEMVQMAYRQMVTL